MHFSADGDTIETVFRTIISINQFSIYGAVSELCDEHSKNQLTQKLDSREHQNWTRVGSHNHVFAR